MSSRSSNVCSSWVLCDSTDRLVVRLSILFIIVCYKLGGPWPLCCKLGGGGGWPLWPPYSSTPVIATWLKTIHVCMLASFPGPAQLSVAYSMEKAGAWEQGYMYSVLQCVYDLWPSHACRPEALSSLSCRVKWSRDCVQVCDMFTWALHTWSRDCVQVCARLYTCTNPEKLKIIFWFTEN